MRLLLDENLPRRLIADFSGHEVFTVREKGWQGLKNSDLLKQMVNHGFDALLTFDKNLHHQQNFYRYPISVFVISATINSYEELTKLSGLIRTHLENPPLPTGGIIITAS
jgi:hypothetical protein